MPKIVDSFTKSATNGSGPWLTERQLASGWRPCRPVELRLALEDDVLEPPVMRVYRIPNGKWVTIELDLNEAVKARGLKLAKIANFWLLGRASERAEVRIDNIRIVRRGVPAKHDLIRRESPRTFPVARRKQPQVPDLPSGLVPDRAPVQLAEPIVVARGSIVPFGWVAAYDNRFLFVAYSFTEGTSQSPMEGA